MHLQLVVNNSDKKKDTKSKTKKALDLQKVITSNRNARKLSAEEVVNMGAKYLNEAYSTGSKEAYLSAEKYFLAAKKLGDDLDSNINLSILYYFMGAFEASLDMVESLNDEFGGLVDEQLDENCQDMNETIRSKRFIEIAKDNLKRFPRHWALHATLGMAYYINGDLKKAQVQYSMAENNILKHYSDSEIKSNMQMITPIYRHGEMMFHIGIEKENEEEFYWKRLENKFLKVKEYGMENSQLYYYLGSIEVMKENFNKAVGYFNQSLEIDPRNFDTVLNMFWVFIDTKDYKKAKEYLKSMKNIDPENENCVVAEEHLKKCTRKRISAKQDKR